MIQEISALFLFFIALFYSFIQLVRFLIPVNKNYTNNCGSTSCSCKAGK